MTNLPITTNAPQTVATNKQPANAADTGSVQDSQPFGEVLARQITEPAAKDAKAGDKLAAEILAQLGSDTNSDNAKTDVVATDASATLPADMLAALLPQAMNSPNATVANASATDVKVDGKTVDSAAGLGKRTSAPAKVDKDTSGMLSAVITQKAAPATTTETQAIETPVATNLAAPANRVGTELASAMREAVSVAIQQPGTATQSNAAALASLQNSAASIAPPAMQLVQATINTPVNQNKWSDEFSQKITWLASSNQDQTAELHLNPPQLGPLDVVIKVSGDQATALFTSPHAAVREAVEQAMPKLRDMLAENGIMLGNTTVSDQAPRDQSQPNAQRSAGPANNLQDSLPSTSNTVRVSPISRHNGIVDTFA